MSTTARRPELQPVHDEVVRLVAQRWSRLIRSKITITTGLRESHWEEFEEQAPDLVGWKLGPNGRVIEWIAEVETEQTLPAPETRRRWHELAIPGVPFHLFVPKGERTLAELYAVMAGVPVTSIYEYELENETFRIS